MAFGNSSQICNIGTPNNLLKYRAIHGVHRISQHFEFPDFACNGHMIGELDLHYYRNSRSVTQRASVAVSTPRAPQLLLLVAAAAAFLRSLFF
jgi:hypothetical protein